jgi:hypothetical protein
MPNPSTLRIACPGCRALIVVDVATGEVLSHEAPKGPKADMDEALKALRESKGKREDAFKKSLSAEKNKSDLLGKKFQEAVRRAQENPDAAPPPREIDL